MTIKAFIAAAGAIRVLADLIRRYDLDAANDNSTDPEPGASAAPG